MAIEINLLSSRNKKHLTFERSLLIVKIAAVLLVIVTISLAIITFFLSNNSNQQSLILQQDSLSAKLTTLQKNAEDLAFTHDRVKRIQTISTKQYAFENVLSIANDQTPQDVNVSTTSLSKSQLQLTISST